VKKLSSLVFHMAAFAPSLFNDPSFARQGCSAIFLFGSVLDNRNACLFEVKA